MTVREIHTFAELMLQPSKQKHLPGVLHGMSQDTAAPDDLSVVDSLPPSFCSNCSLPKERAASSLEALPDEDRINAGMVAFRHMALLLSARGVEFNINKLNQLGRVVFRRFLHSNRGYPVVHYTYVAALILHHILEQMLGSSGQDLRAVFQHLREIVRTKCPTCGDTEQRLRSNQVMRQLVRQVLHQATQAKAAADRAKRSSRKGSKSRQNEAGAYSHASPQHAPLLQLLAPRAGGRHSPFMLDALRAHPDMLRNEAVVRKLRRMPIIGMPLREAIVRLKTEGAVVHVRSVNGKVHTVADGPPPQQPVVAVDVRCGVPDLCLDTAVIVGMGLVQPIPPPPASGDAGTYNVAGEEVPVVCEGLYPFLDALFERAEQLRAEGAEFGKIVVGLYSRGPASMYLLTLDENEADLQRVYTWAWGGGAVQYAPRELDVLAEDQALRAKGYKRMMEWESCVATVL